jgi:glycosyltransferase involved in cell wall biosynthesis
MTGLISDWQIISGRLKGSRHSSMNTYFERYAYPIKLFANSPKDSLKISVVIPCYNEPDILSTLNSLNNCIPVDGVEILIIINEAENCNKAISRQNRTTLDEIKTWESHNKLNFTLLTYHLIAPDKDAGVGLARKVGMDEAARRFAKINLSKGVICCFDADSTCTANYLESINQHFYLNKVKPNGAAVYYEHVIPTSGRLKEGITQYELHLRYYVHALRMIGYPYAHQTVGSSMIVRSDVYQKVGGMNKRKAGEDFYFLHRVMPTGNFIDISDTIIYPSARISDRVPFGTGKAMDKWTAENPAAYLTYNLQSFKDLNTLFNQTEACFNISTSDLQALMSNLPESTKSFLSSIGFNNEVVRLNNQSNNLSTFINKWYQYFDGFMVLKYLHYARDNYHENKPVTREAARLADILWFSDGAAFTNATAGLSFYRQKDKVI